MRAGHRRNFRQCSWPAAHRGDGHGAALQGQADHTAVRQQHRTHGQETIQRSQGISVSNIDDCKIQFMLWIYFTLFTHVISVSDPGCLYRIPDPDFFLSRISDPGSRIPNLGSRIPNLGSRIPDLTTAPKEEEEIFCPKIFLCSHKCHKIVNNFIFEQVNTKNFSTFYPKICH